MIDKKTEELEKILESTHSGSFAEFLSSNQDAIIQGERCFASYMREIIKEKNLLWQEVFLNADIPERYGYKLISEEKRTKQRDIILRICYAAKFTLTQTQRALKIYGMPELYSRVPREAALMICFNERPGSILDVNSFLKRNYLVPLRSCGVQE